MAITGYTIYRYKDKKDPKLLFDIVIYEGDSTTFRISEVRNIHIPTNIKLPFGTNNLGFNIITSITKNPNANLQIYLNSTESLVWNFKGNSLNFTYAPPGTAGKSTSSFTVAYPLIIHNKTDNKYYFNQSNSFIFYNRDIENIRTIWESHKVYNTYESIQVNIDKDVDPIYPWFPNDIKTIITGDNSPSFTVQDYMGMYPHYNADMNDCTSFIRNILNDSTILDINDPNSDQPNSTPSGGGGTNDIGGDTNEDDGLPSIDVVDSGLMTAYNPTVGELQALGQFLWSDTWSLDNFKKLFNDPFDTLLGLSIVPIAPRVSGKRSIYFGNLDSGVSANVLSDQWVPKDLGSVTLNEVWKGALDYSPNTACSIYLPFIGVRQLNINDVMGSTIHLIYKFDVITGTCIAQLYINHNARGNQSDDKGFSFTRNQGLVYEFIGQCAVSIGLSSQDFTNMIRSAIGAVGMVAGATASIATGNPALGISTLAMGSANSAIQAGTPTVERSGHLSGSSALLGYTKAFLIVERPHQVKPAQSYRLRGFPSQIGYDSLSSVHGYTQIADANNIHCSGASDSELSEIKSLLMQGVYLP